MTKSAYPEIFHPTQEKVVNIIQNKVQNMDSVFFRLIVSYNFCKLASMMRAQVKLPGNRTVPVNMYSVNLAPSGTGKGYSVNTMERSVMNGFREEFLRKTFPTLAAKHMSRIAVRRANTNKSSPDTEQLQVEAEFDLCGPLLFSFDSATGPAIKQLRTKLLLANAGSMNLEIDEIGSNLLSNNEALNAFLELFDMGFIKPKLVKNTRDNLRTEDLIGSTPTNMMLFGTPTKLLNGTRIEEEFYSMLEIGYARRCFFGYSRNRKRPMDRTPEELRNTLNDTTAEDQLAKLSSKLALLADPSMFNQKLAMEDKVEIAFLEYMLDCEQRASKYSEYHESKRAEMEHRHFKAAKLAAAYAFVDSSMYVTEDHWNYAVALTEQSGNSFQGILQRDRPYAKLASYIATCGEQLTHSDLVEDLPFYKGTEQQKREMMNLAIAHGYKHGIYIKRDQGTDGIEFLSGKTVPETDLDHLTLAYSNHITENYKNQQAPFNQMHKLVTAPNLHWVSHHLKNGYRNEESAMPGVDIAVIDVDDEISCDMAQLLLQDYTWLMHTTKRHTDQNHRFRILFPMSHHLELTATDFKEFMSNIYDWMPFECDRQTNQRSRKWLTHKGKHWYNDGKLLDSLQFVPKTKKAEEHKKIIAGQTSLNNLERWFINNTGNGNRNNQLYRYAMCLVDMGQDIDSLRNNVLALNAKLEQPLPEAEVLTSVIVSASKKMHSKNAESE